MTTTPVLVVTVNGGPVVTVGGGQHALAALALSAGSARDLGFAGLITGDAADVDGYLERVLGPVAAHDARHGTDLLATPEACFAAASVKPLC